jgi:hypothetical protein
MILRSAHGRWSVKPVLRGASLRMTVIYRWGLPHHSGAALRISPKMCKNHENGESPRIVHQTKSSNDAIFARAAAGTAPARQGAQS